MSSAAKVTSDCAPRDGPQGVMGERLPYLLGGTVPPAPAFSPLRDGMWQRAGGGIWVPSEAHSVMLGLIWAWRM